MWTGILWAAAVCAGLGLAGSVVLVLASRFLAVPQDERVGRLQEVLPGANCGACGYAGCADYAQAIAGGAPVNKCVPGGEAVAKAAAAIMGVEAGAAEKMVAFVKCKGTCDKANVQYNYYGMDDCVKIAAAVPGAGDKACSYGCLGSGSCVKACQFDAIHIVDGVAVVDKEKCVACGACAAVCPRHLIDLVPYKAEHLVQCNSHDKGADVKKKCDAGCIGCTLCTKQCEADAIHMDNNVAVIDYEKCTN